MLFWSRYWVKALLALGLAAGASVCGWASPRAVGPLHVASPQWQDQVIYFLMTDRFDDGDARNNDQGAGEYDPQRATHYSGGDLRGVLRRLDYIRGLGATAVWITPPVANQWINPSGTYGGYHGYWAHHFKRVDTHLGSLADYQALSRALHARGMYLVQDIVLNHTGDYFYYGPNYDASDPSRDFRRQDRSPPVAAPTQAPFHLNDARRADHRRAGIYHWTPDVKDYSQRHQELNFQMSGLDDLNTENPRVRRALRDSYGHWIRQAGVDAFRVDTAFYVPPDLVRDFLFARDPRAPGVMEVARRTGRHNFFVFGEGFATDKPGAQVQSRKIESYMTDEHGQALMPGMLNFPLYGALTDVLARGRPAAQLGDRIERMMRVHARPHLMPTFVDNHDVDRFLAAGSPAALQQALLSIFTLPGIPTIYYGTEQGFTRPRSSMFAAGHGSQGRDHFDTTAALYRTIASLAQLRREHRVFSRGTPQVLWAQSAGPGAVAWRMTHGSDSALVVLNTADRPTLLDAMSTPWAPGSVLQGLWSSAPDLPATGHTTASAARHTAPADVTVGPQGQVSLLLPPRAAWVWRLSGGTAAERDAAPAAASTAWAGAALEMVAQPAQRVYTQDFDVVATAAATGLAQTAVPGQSWRAVVDGDVSHAVALQPGSDGLWRARIDTSAMMDPQVEHRVVLWQADAPSLSVSAPITFSVRRDWRLVADVTDPPGDDWGPQGRYTYPTDPGWGSHRQMDLRRVQVLTAGGALRLSLTMHDITTQWNPANGFDHVAFTVFIELPGASEGATVMPLQSAQLPAGMRWHRRLRVHGWTNALFDPRGASAQNEGSPLGFGAHIEVDRTTRTVHLTVPASALGRLTSLSGARVYVTTWDYDGGYRALLPQAAGFSMGGRVAPNDALIMDDTPIITIP